MFAFAIGVGLALAVGLFLTFLGMDRDRSLYPAIMLVIAFLYSLFAVVGGSTDALLAEAAVGVLFAALTVAGFLRSLWLVVAALALHGAFDFVHGRFIHNAGVPDFWPAFCGAYDITAAAYLAILVTRDRIRPARTEMS
jgi:hypothetical protein